MEPLIPFCKPYLTGKEEIYLKEAVTGREWAGDGPFSRRSTQLLSRLAGKPVYLTSSGTHALELAVMALNLEPGSEVILPSFTFSSTANAVVNVGLKPVFVDIRRDTLNIDETLIEESITRKTRAVIPVHYAGVGCEMGPILETATKYGLKVIEDAAQGIMASYEGKPLGSLGDLGILSFHQTKNITCGEGGAIIVSNPAYVKAVEIHREKGTNRTAFLRNETSKYVWLDRGSSYLLGDLLASFLYAQLLELDQITQSRKERFDYYRSEFESLNGRHLRLPVIPEKCRSNYHLFFVLLESKGIRDRLMDFLRERGIEATFHFHPLHNAPAAEKFSTSQRPLPVTVEAGETLLRLPLYPDLQREEQKRIVDAIKDFFS